MNKFVFVAELDRLMTGGRLLTSSFFLKQKVTNNGNAIMYDGAGNPISYYVPEICRFINADAYASTSQGFLGLNMFAYCCNNPVNRIDPTGVLWKEIKAFFKKVGSTISNGLKSVFGAGSSSPTVEYSNVLSRPKWGPVKVTTGVRAQSTNSTAGDSSKPLSVFAEGRLDNPVLSGAGVAVNISDVSLKLHLSLDDIGLHISSKKDNVTNEAAVIINISQLKVGVESERYFMLYIFMLNVYPK